jgi:5'-3' exonuclease
MTNPTDVSSTVPSGVRPKVLVVDGPSLAHRAYHAYEAQDTRSTAGTPIWAVQGFLNLFAGVLNMVRPAAVIVGWDGDAATSVRRAEFPTYKANRPQRPEALTTQLGMIPRLLAEIGFAGMCPEGLEADDVLASVAAAVEHCAAVDCVVATSDRDAFSLISERTTVLRLVSGLQNAVWMNPGELLERYGLQAVPNQYGDFAALRGDKSDNLPGVCGVGEKTAVKLLAALGSVTAALADPDATRQAIGTRFADKLIDGADVYHRNRRLMGMRADLPVDLAAARKLPDPDHAGAVCVRYEVNGSRLTTVLRQLRPQPQAQAQPRPAPAAARTALRLAPAGQPRVPGTVVAFPVTL